jgi:SAM-dependent methyltransferase
MLVRPFRDPCARWCGSRCYHTIDIDGGATARTIQPWSLTYFLEAVKLVRRTMGPFEDVLELACGPGWWTNELVQIGGGVTAIDASPEILALNRGNVGNGNVSYRQADLF